MSWGQTLNFILGTKDRIASYLDEPDCQWPGYHIHRYTNWCNGRIYKRRIIGCFSLPICSICSYNFWYQHVYSKLAKQASYSITGLGIPISFLIRVYILGMSSLYTLTAMAAIRFKSVIWHDRSWHLTTHVTYFTSRYVQLLWLFAFAVAIPPIIGLGKYAVDIGMIRYNSTWPFCIELF